MATTVLQPENCRRECEIKAGIPEDFSDKKRVEDVEAKERETGDLPEELLELAKEELREEPAIREHALGQMRHFIEKHPAIRKCRTGTKL